MKDKVKVRTLPGFMELLPKEQILFERIRGKMEEIYQSFGFFPLDTPVLEHSEILLAKAGGETEKQIYRFDRGDTDLTMRFDLTVPLAKYAALYSNDLVFPFRRYQIGKVYRGERAQKGRFREFYQADIDIIGDGSLSLKNDAEIPCIIYRVLTELGVDEFVIRLNNRKILNGLFAVLNIRENPAEILRVIDKLDKIGAEKVKEELLSLGVETDAAGKLLTLLTEKKSNEETLAGLRDFEGKDETLDLGIKELAEVLSGIRSFGVPESYVEIDLAIARGLDYYTGTVYETMVKKHPEIGSVCSGGRYDDLAGFYTERKLPGVGMSIGLTRLFYILEAGDHLNRDQSSATDVLVLPMTEDLGEAARVAETLRKEGIRTQIYYEEKKFKQKMAYADRLSVPFCLFLGEDELAEHVVSLKNMSTGEQVKVEEEKALAIIKEELDRKRGGRLVDLS